MRNCSGKRASKQKLVRIDLQRHDLSIHGWEAIQVRVDFAPGAVAAPHKHPGEEIIYVLQGTLEYMIADKPPQTFKAGDVLFIPYGVVQRLLRPRPSPLANGRC
jgi:quercetin dioxygenase-like cupin family protein